MGVFPAKNIDTSDLDLSLLSGFLWRYLKSLNFLKPLENLK